MSADRRSRNMYIWQATFEYLVSMLISGSYLATLTRELGMSDSLTGILSSVISLGCLFQLLSLTFRIRRVKSFVITFSIINQLLFMFLYIVPLVHIPAAYKSVIFVACIFTAYLLFNLAHPNKINWMMSFVEDHHRGTFTANKEMTSLLVGIVFSFLMGNAMDHFREQGRTALSFVFGALVILVLMVLHTLSMAFAGGYEQQEHEQINLTQKIKNLAKNKAVLKISLVFILYYVANYVAVPYYGAYCVGALGFNLKTVSVFTIIGSVSRILVSRVWGAFADKKGFAKMLEKCLLFLVLSFVCMAFSVPQNGLLTYGVYVILHGVSMGGINSAMINLIYDYVDTDMRADALAITQAVAGLTGFLTTLAVSPLVAHIQNRGDSIFGIQLYAPQVLSILGVILTMVVICYIRFTVMKIKKPAPEKQ